MTPGAPWYRSAMVARWSTVHPPTYPDYELRLATAEAAAFDPRDALGERLRLVLVEGGGGLLVRGLLLLHRLRQHVRDGLAGRVRLLELPLEVLDPRLLGGGVLARLLDPVLEVGAPGPLLVEVRLEQIALAGELGGVALHLGDRVADLGEEPVARAQPLAEVLELVLGRPLRRRGIARPLREELERILPGRLHVDAAYGGYFKLAANLTTETRTAMDALGQADSLVVDPHKHGLQPYGCGCVVFRNPAVGAIYKHDSPYTYFTSGDLHLGEISLECSRAGASAVALWATQKLLPLVPGGEFAAGLEACREAALDLSNRLNSDVRWLVPVAPELDIVVWAPRAPSARRISELSHRIFDAAAKRNLHLALMRLPVRYLTALDANLEPDEESVLCLRSVLMKSEHREWLERLWEILNQAADEAGRESNQPAKPRSVRLKGRPIAAATAVDDKTVCLFPRFRVLIVSRLCLHPIWTICASADMTPQVPSYFDRHSCTK